MSKKSTQKVDSSAAAAPAASVVAAPAPAPTPAAVEKKPRNTQGLSDYREACKIVRGGAAGVVKKDDPNHSKVKEEMQKLADKRKEGK